MGLLRVYAGDFGPLLGQFWAIEVSIGRCDAYRCGLGGAESENVHANQARSKVKTGLSTPTGPPRKRAGAVFRSLRCHFLHPLGALGDHFGVTLCT